MAGSPRAAPAGTVRAALEDVPLLDQHCHPVVRDDAVWRRTPYQVCFSEAQGAALEAVDGTNVAFQRAKKEVAGLYECEEDVLAMKAWQERSTLPDALRLCARRAGIDALLVDDGIRNEDLMTFDGMEGIMSMQTLSVPVHRVFRVETAAELYAEQVCATLPAGAAQMQSHTSARNAVHTALIQAFANSSPANSECFEKISRACADKKIVALKTAVCYRGGLGIPSRVQLAKNEISNREGNKQLDQLIRTFGDPDVAVGNFGVRTSGTQLRISGSPIGHFVAYMALDVCAEVGKPLQIHTGLGDNDLKIHEANPALLRAFIEDAESKNVPIVLLHGGWPYTREAAFLTANHANVWLDVGLAPAMLSTPAAREMMREAFSIAPLNKIMASTDGHTLPEMFYSGAVRIRALVSDTLQELVDEGDLSLQDAVAFGVGILHNNATRLYKLQRPGPVEVPAAAASPASTREPSAADVPARGLLCREGPGTDAALQTELRESGGWLLRPPPAQGSDGPPIRLVRYVWTDVAGLRRCRAVPWRVFERAVSAEGNRHGLGLTRACMAMPCYADGCVPDSGLSVVGEVRLTPDASTLMRLPWCPTHAMALCHLLEPGTADGSPGGGGPWACCPRSALADLLAAFEEERGCRVRVGIECEFVVLGKVEPDRRANSGLRRAGYAPLDTSAYCATSSFNEHSELMSAIVDAIEGLGLEVEQIHAESAGGQFEVVIGHVGALAAADAVVMVREAVQGAVAKYGDGNLVACFLPKVLKDHAGNGAHLHLSLWKPGQGGAWENVTGGGTGDAAPLSPEGAAFAAGILNRLPGLVALLAGNPASFHRVQPSTWSGAFRCWGVENREAPLRACVGAGGPAAVNIEIKCVDHTANPYVAIAALVAAGREGIAGGERLPAPVSVDPGAAGRDFQKQHGIVRMPTSTQEALGNLQEAGCWEALADGIGEKLLRAAVAVRAAEAAELGGRGLEDIVERLATKF
ncbi:unnamed protein product [Pedinophyceae sp. YPF-701]|nr:unnamed protein product [Pedinophyceae sp. YPF-701]